MPSIFNYHDYRKFLGDYYEEKKTSRSAFSYQNFSRSAGFHSKSFMFNVINDIKNLSRASVVKICEALELSKTEAAYFENLVYFNQAPNFTERNFYYEKLNAIYPVTTEASNARRCRPASLGRTSNASRWSPRHCVRSHPASDIPCRWRPRPP